MFEISQVCILSLQSLKTPLFSAGSSNPQQQWPSFQAKSGFFPESEINKINCKFFLHLARVLSSSESWWSHMCCFQQLSDLYCLHFTFYLDFLCVLIGYNLLTPTYLEAEVLVQ